MDEVKPPFLVLFPFLTKPTSPRSKGSANGTQPYAALPPEAVLGNSLGVLIVVFVAVVLGILSNPKWQRPDSPPGERAYAVRTPREKSDGGCFWFPVSPDRPLSVLRPQPLLQEDDP